MRLIRTLSICALLVAVGCAKPKVAPDYARQLEPGQAALRLVTDPARMPNLAAAFGDSDRFLLDSIDQSIRWFAAPSSKQFFPIEGISHEQARASLVAFRDVAERSQSAEEFSLDVNRLFHVYESVGYDGQGTVLFTGYFTPIFSGSLARQGEYQYPLYQRPSDLATDPVTGQPRGRVLADGSYISYPSRGEIESSEILAGSELVWLNDPLSAYLIHVNGSAKLRLDEGREMFVGYAGKTDREYASLGKAIIEAGMVKKEKMNLPAIKRAYEKNPQKVIDLMKVNESYVFFKEYDGSNWPSGSLGVRVTADRSIATDKKIFPRGGIIIVDTDVQTISQGHRPTTRLMLDQDTGGAIRAPGRADLFRGIGPTAEILAGGQYAEGRLFYLFLKPQFVKEYSTPQGGNSGTGTIPSRN